MDGCINGDGRMDTNGIMDGWMMDRLRGMGGWMEGDGWIGME